MWWSVTAGFAQSIQNGNFEEGSLIGWIDDSTVTEYAGGGSWITYEETAGALQASPARGSGSLAVGPRFSYECSPMGCPTVEIDLRTEPFVVTRTSLTYAEISNPVLPVDVELIDVDGETVLADGDTAGAASSDTFANRVIALDAHCGASAQVRIRGGNEFEGRPKMSLDDIAMGGALCAEFVDSDSDGLCPQGTDLDADGDCEDPSELSGGLPIDCDDSSSTIGACLELVEPRRWIQAERRFSLTVRGALPDERLLLVGSTTAGTTCLPAPVDLCLDVGPGLQVLDRADADASGVATFRFAPPFDAYDTVTLQAVAVRPNASIVSDAIAIPVRPASGGLEAGGVPNGDFETGLLPWTPASEIRGWESIQADPVITPCAAVRDDLAARGTDALFTEYHEGFGNAFERRDCADTTRSRPVPVTREAVRWARFGEEAAFVVRELATGASLPLSPVTATAPDGFVESVADLSGACGTAVFIEVSGGLGGTWWDDVAFDGPPCPAYADGDGDGVCASGVDLDGDGACVSDGEPDAIQGPAIAPLESVIDDFEGADPPWLFGPDPFTEFAWSDTPDLPASGAFGGRFDPYNWSTATWNGDFDPGRVRVITHHAVALSVLKGGVGDWRATVVNVGALVRDTVTVGAEDTLYDLDVVPASLPPATWGQAVVDLSSRCGDVLMLVQVSADGWALDMEEFVFASPDPVYIDDLGFVGPVCAEFVDTDADGLCAEGVDHDGDGECVSAGEPDPGVVHDGDE